MRRLVLVEGDNQRRRPWSSTWPPCAAVPCAARARRQPRAHLEAPRPRTTPTSCSAPTATRGSHRTARATRPTTCTQTWPCCSARPGPPARRSWSGCPRDNVRSNAREHRRRTWAHRSDDRATDHAAHALLLRVVRGQQPPGGRSRPGPHRPVGRRRRASGTGSTTPRAPRRSPVSPTPSTCSTTPASRAGRSRRCATSRRPAAGWRRTGWRGTPRSGSQRGWDLLRHVRRRPRPRPGWRTCRRDLARPRGGDRGPGPGRRRPARPCAGAASPGRGELVYSRAQRDDGLRRVARRPGAGPDGLRAADRRPRRQAPATACTRSSAARSGTPSCSACGSTSTASSGVASTRARPGARCVARDDRLYVF